MAWIESNQELVNHPKTKRAAKLLNISIPAMLGHLHLLWYWCLDYAQDGDLSRFNSEEIADACLWTGDPDLFIQSLLDCGPGDSHGFLELIEDNTLVVHDWMDYAGRLIEKREANAERMRQKRAEKARAKNVQRTCNERAGATVPNRTVPNQTNITTTTTTAREEISAELPETEILHDNPVDNSVDNVDKLVKPADKSLPIGINTVKWAEANWGRMLSPLEVDTIIGWCDTLSTRGSSEADIVVIEALRECNDAGSDARNMHYLKSVMVNWLEAGVLTVTQVEARRIERKSKQQKHNKGKPKQKTSPEKYENFYL